MNFTFDGEDLLKDHGKELATLAGATIKRDKPGIVHAATQLAIKVAKASSGLGGVALEVAAPLFGQILAKWDNTRAIIALQAQFDAEDRSHEAQLRFAHVVAAVLQEFLNGLQVGAGTLNAAQAELSTQFAAHAGRQDAALRWLAESGEQQTLLLQSVERKLDELRNSFAVASPGRTVRVFGAPMVRNYALVGRAEALEQLRVWLVPDAQRRIVLHGMHGSGKTQLALEHVYAHAAAYRAVLWINADSPLGLRAGLVAHAGKHALDLPEQQDATERKQIDAVLSWLRANDRWLLVLDNVDQMETRDAICSLLHTPYQGNVLITSTLSDWPVRQFQTEELPGLESEDAVRFLISQTRGRGQQALGDEHDALRIVHETAGLPLALVQAVAYLREHRRRFADYLRDLLERAHEVLGHEVEGKSVWTTLLVTEAALPPASLAVLKLSAFYAPDPLPRDPLVERGHPAIADLLQDPQSAPREVLDRALRTLSTYSLLDLREQEFACHTLLAKVQARRLSPAEQKHWIGRAIAWVDAALPTVKDPVRSRQALNPFRPHMVRALDWSTRLGVDEPRQAIRNMLSRSLSGDEHEPAYEPLYRRALQLEESTHATDSPHIVEALLRLGRFLMGLSRDRADEAEGFLRRALEIDESQAPRSLQVARDLVELAKLKVKTACFEQAGECLKSAFEIAYEHPGEKPEWYARALLVRAELLQWSGDFAGSESDAREALELDRDTLGPDHPWVARDMICLARCYAHAKDHADAAAVTRGALNIDRNYFGREHPWVARDLSMLGHVVMAKRGDSEHALACFREALEIDRHVLLADDPQIADDLTDLAGLLAEGDAADKEEAVRYIREAIRIDESAPGATEARVGRDRNILGIVLQRQEEFDLAADEFRAAIRHEEKAFGKTHRRVSDRMNNLSNLLLQTDAFREACVLLERQLEIELAQDVRDDERIAELRKNLAGALRDRQKRGSKPN